MITRHDKGRRLQTVNEMPRGQELRAARSLRQVAADRHQIGLVVVYFGNERLHHARVFGPEMQVGQMHDACHGAGAITRSAPGRTVYSSGGGNSLILGIVYHGMA